MHATMHKSIFKIHSKDTVNKKENNKLPLKFNFKIYLKGDLEIIEKINQLFTLH